MICEICKKDFSSYKGLAAHIRQTNSMSTKNYYDTYIKANSEGVCLECGKQTTFKKLSLGYHIYCSKKCSNISPARASKVSNTLKNNAQFIEQAKAHIIQRNKSYKGRQKSSEIGKITGGQAFKKAHAKYDTVCFCEKCRKETKHMIGIGCVKCWSIRSEERMKQSVQAKYGVQNVFQLDSIKDKIKQTSLARYGCENPGNSREARIKAALTLRQNDNDSSWEDFVENALSALRISYYKKYNCDPRYPYMCDFYLPKLDMFIEINGYWSHGGHWFDSSNADDLIILKRWQEKANRGHKQYANAINVWTVKDPEKLKVAKLNNLNYTVLWTLDDIKSFITYLKLIFKDEL